MSKLTRKLYCRMLKIGCIGFGGGNAVIPIIERECEEFITSEELDKDVLIASITPGALPVEIASGIGKYAAGRIGMVMCAMLMALPGAVATLFLVSCISYCNESVFRQIELLSIGVTIFIVVILLNFIKCSVLGKSFEIENASTVERELVIKILVMCLVFFLTSGKKIFSLLQINSTPMLNLNATQIIMGTLLIILCSEVYSFLKGQTMYKPKKNWNLKEAIKDIEVWFGVLGGLLVLVLFFFKKYIPFLLTGIASSFLSFGGGDSYLTVVDSMFIENQLINSVDFYTLLLPVINILPGSILCKAMTGMGYLYGLSYYNYAIALLGGVFGFITSVVASGFIFQLVYQFYEKYEYLGMFVKLKYWIRPIVSGILLNVIITLILEVQSIVNKYQLSSTYFMVCLVIFLISIFLKWKHVNDRWNLMIAVLIMISVGNILG